jgi:hypothetical protein
MSDKDINLYYDLQNSLFCNLFPTESNTCYICIKPIPNNFQSNNQLFCPSCISTYLSPFTESLSHLSQPKSILPSSPASIPSAKIHPPQSFSYSQSLLHPLIFVCDFFSHFSEKINVESFSLEQLYQSLLSETMTSPFKDICKILTVSLAESLFRPDSEIGVSEKQKTLHLGTGLRKVFDVGSCLHVVWPSVLSELLQVKGFSEYLKGTPVERFKKTLPETLTEADLASLSPEDKLSLLDFLISVFLDSKICHEWIAEKVEHQISIARTRLENKHKIKHIESEMLAKNKNKEELEKEKVELIGEEEKIREELEQMIYRTQPIGVDAHFNEYFFFSFETDKVLVYYPAASSASELGNWYFYGSKEEILQLHGELVQQNKKELHLKQNLEKIINGLLQPGSTFEYKNTKFSDFKPEVSFDNIKTMVKSMEKGFSKYLRASKRRLDVDETEREWKARLFTTVEMGEVKELILEFAERAAAPLRWQKFGAQKKGKYRKVMLKIWQNSPEASSAWEAYLRSVVNNEELYLAVSVLGGVIDSYMARKLDDGNKPIEECFKCKEGGKLVVCENCPRAAHLKCAGLVKMPSKDWHCDECRDETNDL